MGSFKAALGLGYADDLFLMSASRLGLQSMVKICGVFASKRNLKFSTNPDPAKSKTKGIIFSSKPNNVLKIKLNDLSICINDLRTVTGRTLSTLPRLCQCDVSDLSASAVKRSVEYFSVPGFLPYSKH